MFFRTFFDEPEKSTEENSDSGAAKQTKKKKLNSSRKSFGSDSQAKGEVKIVPEIAENKIQHKFYYLRHYFLNSQCHILWTRCAATFRKRVLRALTCVVRRRIIVRRKVLSLAHRKVGQTLKSNHLEPIS